MRKKIFVMAGLAVLVLVSAGFCDHKQRGRIPGPPRPSSTRISVDMNQVPWCETSGGWATAYPCKWDSRESRAPFWDPGVPKVALYVRASTGCPIPVPSGVGCYWAPEDR